MDVSCEMLLHPELLRNEQLLHILKERCLNVSNIERMSRDELLDLFHHYCVPYGQRKYRDSGRGRILNKTRHMSPEPTAKLNVFTPERVGFKQQISENSRGLKSTHCSDRSERLKPPPDLLADHVKRIKLEVKSQAVSIVNNWKRKMSFDSTQPAESPPQKKEKKPITWP